jgi:hypothetical protein
MSKKFLIVLSTAALAMVSAADSYRVTLFQPSVVSGKTLKPGEYRVEVANNRATIKGGKETVEADVRIEAGGQKFGATSVRYQNGEGAYKVEEIRVGGTKTRIVFGAETRPAGV